MKNRTALIGKRLGLASAALVASLGLAACSMNGEGTEGAAGGTDMAPTEAASPAMPSTPAPMETDMAPASDEPFGDACSAVPADGAGSFDGMSQEPVATAASNNPVLSTLVTAVDSAGLVDTLNSAEDITVFAPIDDAFEAMDEDTLNAALDDPDGLLTDVLTMHVVGERLSPDDLAGSHATLNENEEIEVTGSGEDFEVNGEAAVVCGNVQTANATVYLIDAVLLPSS